jgi:hypothetical protein
MFDRVFVVMTGERPRRQRLFSDMSRTLRQGEPISAPPAGAEVLDRVARLKSVDSGSQGSKIKRCSRRGPTKSMNALSFCGISRARDRGLAGKLDRRDRAQDLVPVRVVATAAELGDVKQASPSLLSSAPRAAYTDV